MQLKHIVLATKGAGMRTRRTWAFLAAGLAAIALALGGCGNSPSDESGSGNSSGNASNGGGSAAPASEAPSSGGGYAY
jgi:hypothetical protein